ncbi:GCN5-related N-acetyltransferase [Methanococcus maripaludis C5]|uniref:GCN5-related N-acetyltransferase n=1 Tax=Methanococcus maripaludis (strain C5 / ATCC BAA-1333) TaxID=402880 RepID=A4FWQ3_METM5|nr:GNAT family N-acetyltransferase [Methanococcus maripaludis]ABO34628.1 GCN5-related N-acetyltransferase [Methanococcus maripaludis C5]
MNTNLKINIRPTTVLDVSLIFNFIKELARYENLEDHVLATEDIIKESLFEKKKYAEALIVEADSKAVGLVLFFHNFSTFLGKSGIYIEDLYIKEEFRGIGIGRKIFEYLSNLAKERNCGKIEWTVLDGNPARKFYEKMGGVPVEDWLIYRLTGDKLDELSEKYQSNSK